MERGRKEKAARGKTIRGRSRRRRTRRVEVSRTLASAQADWHDTSAPYSHYQPYLNTQTPNTRRLNHSGSKVSLNPNLCSLCLSLSLPGMLLDIDINTDTTTYTLSGPGHCSQPNTANSVHLRGASNSPSASPPLHMLVPWGCDHRIFSRKGLK